jgi:hypothetical protein
MKQSEARNFMEKPCRFRLKSGKEIYGVIWEWMKENSNKAEYYFASNGVVMNFKKQSGNYNITPEPTLGTYIQLDDIIYAERM